nr:uncharacterized protein LOC127315629 [Lolium perenne]
MWPNLFPKKEEMCLTKRHVCSGDSGGDWELALPERRRRRSGRTQGGRRTPARQGNRFAVLSPVCSEVEDSESDLCASVAAGSSPPPPASALNLGRFWPDPAGRAPSPSPSSASPREGSPEPRPSAPKPPPPPLGSAHFPPLPGVQVRGRSSPAAGGCGSRGVGPSSFRVGALILELPPCPGRPEPREAPPPPLGFAPSGGSPDLRRAGPGGPAQGSRPAREA